MSHLQGRLGLSQGAPVGDSSYPLVNVYVTMERSTMLLMGKLTISMAIFNSYVKLPEGTNIQLIQFIEFIQSSSTYPKCPNPPISQAQLGAPHTAGQQKEVKQGHGVLSKIPPEFTAKSTLGGFSR